MTQKTKPLRLMRKQEHFQFLLHKQKHILFLLRILLLCICPALFGATDFFWEDQEVFSPGRGTFPVSAFNDTISVLAWQEAESVSRTDGIIRVSVALKRAGGDWVIRPRAAGPYAYSGGEPSIVNVSLDKSNRVFLVIAASSTHAEILISEDFGETFETVNLNIDSSSTLAPRIFPMDRGGYLLFVTRVQNDAHSLFYCRSTDGRIWTNIEPFVADASRQLNFLPTHISLGEQELVIYQSFIGNDGPAFQLLAKTSSDGGYTWSQSSLVTDFSNPGSQTAASRYDNQRPHLSLQRGVPFLVWERRQGVGNPQVYGVELNADGSLSGRPQLVSVGGGYCNNPIAFDFEGETTVVWFDNRRGQNHIFLAQWDVIDWRNTDLSGSYVGAANFARPAVSSSGLYLFWQGTRQGQDRIVILKPDTTASPPIAVAQNFTVGRRTRNGLARISLRAPYDSSGIRGYSYTWGRDPDELPDHSISMFHTNSNMVEAEALEDGAWYFTAITQDFAGNWSAPSRLTFIRDTTPPPAAVIIPPEMDSMGYLTSNTFDIRWNPPPASDVAGYTWNLEYLAPPEQFSGVGAAALPAALPAAFAQASVGTVPPRIEGVNQAASYYNRDNGLWRFTVAPIDEAGNIGASSGIVFRLNKYIPSTMVTFVDAVQDIQGILSLRIIGRGFADGGSVSRVYLDRQGDAPYDMEFLLSQGDYRIVSDREIADLRIEGLDEGIYCIGIYHPDRGLYMTRPLVTVDRTGTVKFGDYMRAWQPSWTIRGGRRFVFDASFLIILGVILFCGAGILVSGRGIATVIADSASIRRDALALLTGDLMSSEKKKRMKVYSKRGVGLRIKLASFTIALVLLVVIMVSAPLYLMMTRTQEETLLKGLWDRSAVLLEGLGSSARAYLPSQNILELGFLPAQAVAIPEARYVTITGFGAESTIFNDYIWATNDPGIMAKINTGELQAGVSRLEDILSPRLAMIASELDNRARTQVGELSASITELTREGLSLAMRTDAASLRRLDDIQITTRALETQLNERLAEISRQIGSEPSFSTTRLSENNSRAYIFFKPVMYRQGSENTYFRGLIRLEVSIESIREQIVREQRNILGIIVLVALSALAIGTIGAFVFAIIIILPIKRLVSHVERIRDTDDKSKLEGVEIALKSHDEIALLGNTINDMTHGLVKAAQASQDLTVGKEIQKKFIPLDTDREGNKVTSGFQDAKNVQFFGYYEGAKGVSGDYFDYRNLDGRYYAIIKCDVAGKGIPAALIMIQVATMFLNYFKSWKPTEKGMRLEELVYQINDFIETMGFKGRFAAFTLCLFDSETGVARFCNAGDNVIHWYDASEGRMKTVTLPESPATGVLPNFLVESKGGYAVQKLTIDHGDILLLYTDGIEEAKRKFRDSNFTEIICREGSDGTVHETHTAGQADEEMGPERVEDIINAAMGRRVYNLRKWHNPEGNTELQFDFTNCDGKVEDAVMAMVSVEKIFRLYRDPRAGEGSRVLVDKKVDNFLKEHFRQYRTYCGYVKDYPENDAYMYYTHIKEDSQYDDLTILGIYRK